MVFPVNKVPEGPFGLVDVVGFEPNLFFGRLLSRYQHNSVHVGCYRLGGRGVEESLPDEIVSKGSKAPDPIWGRGFQKKPPRPFGGRGILRAWPRLSAVELAGLDGLGFHDLRRTNATAMVLDGVDVKTAQARLGHSDPRLTLAIYAQATGEGDRSAAEKLGARLMTAVEDEEVTGGPTAASR